MKQPIDTSDEQPEHQSVFHRGKPIDAPQDLEAKPMPRASAWKLIWRIPAVLLLGPVLIIFLLRWIDPPTSAFILQDQFEVLMSQSGAKVEHQWVDLKQISRKVQLAVIAAEDQKFPQHFGFDVAAIEDALDHNTKSKSTRGASTISQQVAKNLFLSSSRNWLRKGLEAYLTLWIEMLWPKERILEVYLNIAQFNDHLFGVGVASQQLFGTQAAKLSGYQAALLAAVLPNPSRYSAKRPTFYVSQRAAWIQQQMRQLGDDYLDRL